MRKIVEIVMFRDKESQLQEIMWDIKLWIWWENYEKVRKTVSSDILYVWNATIVLMIVTLAHLLSHNYANMCCNQKINSNITITINTIVTIRYEVEMIRKSIAIVNFTITICIVKSAMQIKVTWLDLNYKVTITLFIRIIIFNLRWIQAFIAALIITQS